MLLALAASLGFPLATIVGFVLGLAGLATTLLCLLALGDGAFRRGAIGLASGLLLVVAGLWLVGFLPA